MCSGHTIERDGASRQQGLTDAEVTAVVRRAFGPGARLLNAVEIGGGTVNSTYRLTLAGHEGCVLRAGPTKEAAARGPSWLPVDTLQREHALTPYFAPVAPLLPITLAADFTHQLIDRDWVIQSLVPGRPWSELVAELTDDEHASLWRQLGTIARAIHDVAGPAFGPLPPGPSFARWSDLLIHDCDGLVADFARFGLPDEAAQALRMTVATCASILDATGPPRLIHSDLDQRHVFVRRDAGGMPVVSGIIDYEFGRFADPLSETLLLDLTFHLRPDAPPFFDTYGPLPDDAASRWRAQVYRAIACGWTAGDQARQGRDAAPTVVGLARIVRELAAGR